MYIDICPYMVNRKKTSVIYKPTTEKFQEIVNACKSLAEILEHFGIGSGNYKTLKRRLIEDEISYGHITLGLASNRNRKFGPKKDISEYLQNGIKVNSQVLKDRLISSNIFDDKCFKCGQGNEWNGEPLVLQLDHISGDHDDNRLENLRILCPNCHTQTPTFSGRKGKVNHHRCEQCNRKISPDANRCKKCHLATLNHS